MDAELKKTRGGKRIGAGRPKKEINKQSKVIRVSEELYPTIEKIKEYEKNSINFSLIPVTENQISKDEEIEKLKSEIKKLKSLPNKQPREIQTDIHDTTGFIIPDQEYSFLGQSLQTTIKIGEETKKIKVEATLINALASIGIKKEDIGKYLTESFSHQYRGGSLYYKNCNLTETIRWLITNEVIQAHSGNDDAFVDLETRKI